MINIPKEMIIVFAMIFGLYLLVLLAIISDLVSAYEYKKDLYIIRFFDVT